MISWIKKQRNTKKPKPINRSKPDDVQPATLEEDPYHVYDEIDDVTDDDEIADETTYDLARAEGHFTAVKQNCSVSFCRPPLQEKCPNIILPNLVPRAEQTQNRKCRQWDARMESTGEINRGNTYLDYDEPWYEFDISGMGELSKFLVPDVSNKTGSSSTRKCENATWCKKRTLKGFGNGCFKPEAYTESKSIDKSLIFPLRGNNISVFQDSNNTHVSASSIPPVKRLGLPLSCSSATPPIKQRGVSSLSNFNQHPRNTSSSTLKSSDGWDKYVSGQSSCSSSSSGYGDCTSNSSLSYDETQLSSQSPLSRCNSRDVTQLRSQSSMPRRDSSDVMQFKSQSNIPRSDSSSITQLRSQPNLSRLDPGCNKNTIHTQLRSLPLIPESCGRPTPVNPTPHLEEYLYPVNFVSSRYDAPHHTSSQNKTGLETKLLKSSLRSSTRSLSHSILPRQCKGVTSSAIRPPMWANSKNRLLTDLIVANYNSQMFVGFT